MSSPQIFEEAARRYRSIHNLSQESFAVIGTDPEADEQKAKRRDRLNRIAASQSARAMVLAAEASTRNKSSQREVIESISNERIIGSSDFVDFNFLELAVAIGRGVGRIVAGRSFGTGFLVGPRVLMTNNHVIGAAEEGRESILQLDYQDDSDGRIGPVHPFRLDPDLIFLTDRGLDFTIIGVEAVSSSGRKLDDYPWFKLIGETGKSDVGDSINIIQHPRGGLKQIAFRKNEVLAIPKAEKDFLYYSTDTEPGSSGSPCFNDQWELVALHHSGVPATNDDGQLLTKNQTVWKKGNDPNLIDWIANEGIRISAIVSFIGNARIPPASKELRDQMLNLDPPNPVEIARASQGPGRGAGTPAGTVQQPVSRLTDPPKSPGLAHVVQAAGDSITLNIPLSITISLDRSSADLTAGVKNSKISVEPVAPPAEKDDPFEEKVEIDPDWSARTGYDPKFLGFKVPMPALSQKMLDDTAKVVNQFRKRRNPFELSYYNYSVLVNKRRRTAWYSAANIDGDNRFDLGKRKGDRWFKDPRISEQEQLGQEAFAQGIDRGHITRLQDVAWGASIDFARKAVNDTFHFTNCSIQASPFNRGKDRWQGLEQYLLEKHAKPEKRRMVVISGPVFAKNDPIYRNENMDYSVLCPLQFWKVCVLIKEDDAPSATAFILSQKEIVDLPGFEEAFEAAAAQLTLADLEARTGLDFGELKAHDHFAKGGAPGTLEIADESLGKLSLKLLFDYEDIVI